MGAPRRASVSPMSTVLVVDDEELAVRSVAAYLHADGVEAVVAGDAREAERLWRTRRPDAVVLDVRLPAPRAWTCCARCATTPTGRRWCSCPGWTPSTTGSSASRWGPTTT